MWNHLFAIIALIALCIAWVLFQRWLIGIDPPGGDDQQARQCGGCGNCTRKSTAPGHSVGGERRA